MPLGDGFGQLIRPSGVSPIASAPTVVRDVLGDILTGLASEVEQRVKPIAIDQAVQQGRVDGDAGVQGQGNAYTDVGLAYQRANNAAYLARNDIDRDESLAALELQYAANPQGFQEAATAAKSEQIKNARGSLAVSVEQSWDRAIGRRFAKIQSAQVQLGLKNAKEDIDRRLVQTSDILQAAARNGTLSDDAAVEAMQTFGALVDEKAANPLWGYSAVDAQADRAKLAASVASLTAGRHADQLFEEEIAAGRDANIAHARAQQRLSDAFETDPALKGLGETARVAMRGAADNALSEGLRIRKEIALSEQNAARELEKETRQKQRETNESYERRLIGNPGAVSVGEIDAARERGDLTPEQANGLIRVRRAEGDRVAAEQRRAEALVAAAQAQARATERQAQSAARSAQAAERSAASDARTAAAAQRQAFNQGSSGVREVIQAGATSNPDAAYAQFVRRQSVMTPSDRIALRSSIMQGYGQVDTRISGAIRDAAPNEAVGRDYARRYDAWAQANPYASVRQRSDQAKAILGAAPSTGIRTTTSRGGGGSTPAARPPSRASSTPPSRATPNKERPG